MEKEILLKISSIILLVGIIVSIIIGISVEKDDQTSTRLKISEYHLAITHALITSAICLFLTVFFLIVSIKGFYCTRVWTSIDIAINSVLAVILLAASIHLTYAVSTTEKKISFLIANVFLWIEFWCVTVEICCRTYSLITSEK